MADEKERGIKESEGKIRMALIPAESMLEVGKVYTRGAEKYTDFNWERGIPKIEALDALERHVLRWKMGQELGNDGVHEMAHVAFWALALISQWVKGQDVDDFRKERALPLEKMRDFLES